MPTHKREEIHPVSDQNWDVLAVKRGMARRGATLPLELAKKGRQRMRRFVAPSLRLAALCLLIVPQAESQAVEVWMRAFIPNPDNAGQAKDYIVAVPSVVGSVVRLRNVDAAAPNMCFATDDRGFSAVATTSARAETKFTITPTSANSATVTPAQNRTTAAITKKVNCSTGTVLNQGPGQIKHDDVGRPAVADGVVQVIGQVEARNVLTPLGDVGPAIDYSFDIKWTPSTSALTVAVTYGAFPAFEVYARKPGGGWVTVMQRLPTGLPWQLGGDSFGVNTTREVQTVKIQ
jgi:hypothetical protein